MPEFDLFVPNELETHLIVVHDVDPRQLASQRRFCKDRGMNYERFLKSNHAFMRGGNMRGGVRCDWPEDEPE